ncbi:MAG: energy transducer TonB [Ignavibacteria bacterium]|nr:energy transducer TonB [Ignavibacteria bacterium]
MTRYQDQPSFNIRLVWNPNTLRGFIGALIIVSIILSLSTCTELRTKREIVVHRPPPIVLLRLGSGDGTGARKGNLTAEGTAQKAAAATNPLVDAQKSSGASKNSSSDITQSGKVVAVSEAGSGASKAADASADNSVGKSFGDNEGAGLGELGMGKGKGDGFGDIDWGGGGNRTVSKKVLPNFPPGIFGTKVTILFRVAPDGSVMHAELLKKSGNKAVDLAAVSALRQWRFSKLTTNVVMEGKITIKVTYK